VDWYQQVLRRDSDALLQLANHDTCQVFHCSASPRVPMIVLEGKYGILPDIENVPLR
jgi:hypothetical protein